MTEWNRDATEFEEKDHRGRWMEAVGVADALREYLLLLSPADRLELFDRLAHGYCVHCGYVLPQRSGCFCTNDE